MTVHSATDPKVSPSGEKAIPASLFVWPVRTRSCSPVSGFQRRTVLSLDAEATRPLFGENH